jgi:tetratricopeptide (TPR) repeat protein
VAGTRWRLSRTSRHDGWVLSASELHRRGLDASNAGRNGQARRFFVTALERNPGHELSARILLSLAYVQFELGSTAEALALCEAALDIEGTSGETRGLIHSQLGVIHTGAGNGDAALTSFGRALPLLEDAAEPQATALLNRSFVHLQRGDIPRALADSAAAQSRAAEGGLEVLRAKAEHNLGYASLLAGDLTAALVHMESARGTLEGLSTMYRAMCNQDRAEVLVAAGMVSDAEDALREAAKAYGTRALRQRQAEAELVLSRLMLRENPVEAGRIARRAARRFRGRGSETWALRADLVSLSSAVATGRASGAVPDADVLERELSSHGLARDAKVAALQAVHQDLGRGRLDRATDRTARLRISTSEPLTTRLLDRETRSKLAAAHGRKSVAAQHIRRGLADLHYWQSAFGSIDLQSSLVGHGRGLALQGLSLAVDDGRPEVVFEWAERARALASRVSPVRPHVDDETAAELSELRQLQAEIIDAESRGVLPKPLIAHANRLRGRIRQRAWYGRGSGEVTEPAALDEAVGALEVGAGTLLSYLVVDEHLYCLVVTAGHPEVVSLGDIAAVRAFLDGMQADLDMAAARMSPAMSAAIRGSLRQRLGLLGTVLTDPLKDRLGDGPLVVVPSGSLAGVPWSLLPAFVRRPLTIPRSATSWLADRGSPFGHASAGFVAGPRVDRAAEEVAVASRAWAHAEVLAGAAARSQPVHRLASRVDVFHAAAHGRHSADNPLFSGLELADGPWFGYDIDQLGAIPTTVVLSACEVGRSSVRWGEETIGMTVAWLHAGARCVIASPALVNDDTACEVLAATHARLAAGAAPSEALAAGIDEIRPDAPAPFLVFGNGW